MRYKTSQHEQAASKAPRTKPAEVRLGELMAAAEKLFLEQGVEATTINQIVESAQVAKGTFYHYFASKNELLEAMGKRYTSQFLRQLEDAVETCAPDDWLNRLRTWVRASVLAYVETYRTHDIVYTNHHHHDRSNLEKSAVLEQLEGILQGGKKAGAWQLEQPRITALLIYAGVHGATDEAIALRQKDCTQYAHDVASVCLHLVGVAPEPQTANRRQTHTLSSRHKPSSAKR
jgi:AcrR family transcriptional regulator